MAGQQLAQWGGRAQRTTEVAHQFKQAAVEAVELLQAALHGWGLQDLHHGIDEGLAVLGNHHSAQRAQCNITLRINLCVR